MENKTQTKTTSSATSQTEKNKAALVKIYQCFETGKLDELDNLIDANCVEHTPDPFVQGNGLSYVKDLFKNYRNAFPDMKITVNDLIAEEDKVCCYNTFTGTNKGTLMGKPATNKSVKIDQMDIVKFKNGKATEHWGVIDMLTMMEQLGIIEGPSDSIEEHVES